ncbi:MAG: AraC family transcriptional regulator ligand-binding domain-containing protein [Myxococcales bacterium]|nr:AraC family transcriptional regulator ligand-binding domain-containing protein [Myxococcales bacterium]
MNQVEAWNPKGAISLMGASEPTTPQVSGLLLRALAEVLQRFDVEHSSLLQRCDIQGLRACEPVDVRVPLSEYRALLAEAIALTGEPALGLRCALHASDSAFDLLAPLVAHVPTLRHAIQETRQFQALAFDGAYVHLTERLGVARLRCEFPRSHEATDRTIAEFLVAGLLRMLRGFGCTRGDLQVASFEHKRPAYHHVYTEAFEGTERFSQDFTGVEFTAELLDRPNLHANVALQTIVHAQAEQRLERIQRPASLVERLKTYLHNQPAARVPDMAVAARELGVSVRSLRRRLAEAGLSYRVLTRDIQRERACTMLRNPDFTLQAVADALGFADTAGFHRAFRRWTGQTACEYRRAWPDASLGRSSHEMAGPPG